MKKYYITEEEILKNYGFKRFEKLLMEPYAINFNVFNKKQNNYKNLGEKFQKDFIKFIIRILMIFDCIDNISYSKL